MTGAPLLELCDLSVAFDARGARVLALDGVSLSLAEGETLGLVGESGSGKSVTALAIMGLLQHAARVTRGAIRLAGRDLLAMGTRERDRWRGAEAAMIFQDPRAALNPIRGVGQQIADVIARHDPGPPADIRRKVLAALRQARLADAEARLGALPADLSRGQCQRVGIAAALACAPRLLIADEPTTGLDVTTQAGLMDLLGAVAAEHRLATLLITHDLALAATRCDRIAVMHAGQVVEVAPVAALFNAPRHPYTKGLLRSMPARAHNLDDLAGIPGSLPDLARTDLPVCRFAERCPRRRSVCDAPDLALTEVAAGHALACRNPS